MLRDDDILGQLFRSLCQFSAESVVENFCPQGTNVWNSYNLSKLFMIAIIDCCRKNKGRLYFDVAVCCIVIYPLHISIVYCKIVNVVKYYTVLNKQDVNK